MCKGKHQSLIWELHVNFFTVSVHLELFLLSLGWFERYHFRWTERPSSRDARMHLKIRFFFSVMPALAGSEFDDVRWVFAARYELFHSVVLWSSLFCVICSRTFLLDRGPHSKMGLAVLCLKPIYRSYVRRLRWETSTPHWQVLALENILAALWEGLCCIWEQFVTIIWFCVITSGNITSLLLRFIHTSWGAVWPWTRCLVLPFPTSCSLFCFRTLRNLFRY